MLSIYLNSHLLFCLLSTAILRKKISGKIDINEAREISLPVGMERAGNQRLGF